MAEEDVETTVLPLSPDRSNHPDNVLLAILFRAVADEPESVYFPAQPDHLHRIFSCVMQQCPNVEMRRMFNPLENTPYPYVPRLSAGVAHLEHARILGKLNPDFAVYKFAPRSARVVLDRLAPRLLTDATVDELSRAFWAAVKAGA